MGKQKAELMDNSNKINSNNEGEVESEKIGRFKGVKLLSLGLISVLTLTFFAFISPTVISRWTEGDYIAITISISVILALTIILLSFKPAIKVFK